tara:strand:- start:400 stop:834 length:435 start_codon:yes stop_codon:yes gene_type:complete
MIRQKRIDSDIDLLRKHNCPFTILKNKNKINITIIGPKDSFYENQKYIIKIEFSKNYPFNSPSVGFKTKIFHPNVDDKSGSICLDVLNQNWTPIYSLLNIWETLIPQLLMYPNPEDPLNSHAAMLMKKDETLFKKKIKEVYNIQ